jgi:hypothetical protein
MRPCVRWMALALVLACASAQEKAAKLVARAQQAQARGQSAEANALYDQALALAPRLTAAALGKSAALAPRDPTGALAALAVCEDDACFAARGALLEQVLTAPKLDDAAADRLVAVLGRVSARDLEARPCLFWNAVERQGELVPSRRRAFVSALAGAFRQLGPVPDADDEQMVRSGKRLLYSEGMLAGDAQRCEDGLNAASAAEGEFLSLRVGTLDQVSGTVGGLLVAMDSGQRKRFFLHGLLDGRLESRTATLASAEAHALPLGTDAEVKEFLAHLASAGQPRSCALFELVSRVRALPASGRAAATAAARDGLAQLEQHAAAVLGGEARKPSLPPTVARSVQGLVDSSKDCGELLGSLRQVRQLDSVLAVAGEGSDGPRRRAAREEQLLAHLLRARLEAGGHKK